VTVAALGCAVVVAALVVRPFGRELRQLAGDVINLHSGPGGASQLDPSAFSTGACMAFTPTSGNNGRTVFLDAGHGGRDPGGVGTTQSGQTIEESNVNLAIELDVLSLLRARGYRVVVSRTADTSVVRLNASEVDGNLLSVQGAHDDVAARDVCANLARADLLVGIYMDAGSPSTAGSVTLYDPDRPFAAASRTFAALLQNDVVSTMDAHGWQIPNDGSVSDAGYGSSVGDPASGGLAAAAAAYNHLLLLGPAQAGYFSTPSLMPGAVIEPLYLTDPFEGSIAVNPADQQVIARGIATAIDSYLSPPAPEG
jgi:N-acetylmuramoyl-L-alanine amidase